MKPLFLLALAFSLSLTTRVAAQQIESLPPCNLPDGPIDASRLLELRDCTFDRPLSLTLNYIIVDSLGHPVDSEDYGRCRHYDSREWMESNGREIKKLTYAQVLLSRHPEITYVKIDYYRNGKEKGNYPSVDGICSILKSFSSSLQSCRFGNNLRGYPRIVISIGR